MGSMMYCAFYNAFQDIQNKIDYLDEEADPDDDPLDGDELMAAKSLLELLPELERIIDYYES